MFFSLCHIRLFATPWMTAHQASLSFTISRSLLKPLSIESVIWFNHHILRWPLLCLSSVFPNIRVLSNESALHIKWSYYWNFSFSTSPPNEYSGLISFMIDCFESPLDCKEIQSLPNTTVQKHHCFGAQLSLWSHSHIHTWLLEKPQLWLYGPLSAEWCLCFLIS